MVTQKSIVTYVEANGAFIHVWMQDNLESAESLHTRISSVVPSCVRAEEKEVKVGAEFMALATDTQFYRVRIIRPNFDFDRHFRCFFVDYGNFETLPLDRLFKLPESISLTAVPQLARCYMLDGIVARTADAWPDNLVASLGNRLIDREYAVELLGQCGPYPVVRLYDIKNGFNVVDFLSNAGLGRRESAYGRWISYVPPNSNLISGTKLVVQIVDGESASDFAATLVDPSVLGVDLKTVMLATAKAQKQPITVQLMPHMLCLARDPVDGNSFFRAEVISAEHSLGVQLRLLDVGKKVILPPSSLYVLTPELLRLPILALHMCLGGLELSSDDQLASSQVDISWLRELSVLQTPISVTILHALSPNFYAVAVNEIGLCITTPLAYRLLPLLGQRPFDLFLNRSLSASTFSEPVLPAVVNSSLSSFDSLMAAFLSYLTVNDLAPLPVSAVRGGVFCIALSDSDKERSPYPVRCVILSPIIGPQMRCLLYEIDNGRQSIRTIDQVFCAPAFAFAHPSFCVPVIAFDAEGKPASPRVGAAKVRAIHREPVGTQAGIVVVQEVMLNPTTYDNAGRILHPVIEEVIIDDWNADTTSESTGCAAEEIAAEMEQYYQKDAVPKINDDVHESEIISDDIMLRDSRNLDEQVSSKIEGHTLISGTVNNSDSSDATCAYANPISGDNEKRVIDALAVAYSSLSVAMENKEFDFTSYSSPDICVNTSHNEETEEHTGQVEVSCDTVTSIAAEVSPSVVVVAVEQTTEATDVGDQSVSLKSLSDSCFSENVFKNLCDATDNVAADGEHVDDLEELIEKSVEQQHIISEEVVGEEPAFETAAEMIEDKGVALEETGAVDNAPVDALCCQAPSDENKEEHFEEVVEESVEVRINGQNVFEDIIEEKIVASKTINEENEEIKEIEQKSEVINDDHKNPVFSFSVDDECGEEVKKEALLEIEGEDSDYQEDDASSNALGVHRKGSLIEWQYSVPPRSLSVNAEANQQLSPSCPFSIFVTPASRLNSFDPSSEIGTEDDVNIAVSDETENSDRQAEIAESVNDDTINTPPPSIMSTSVVPSSRNELLDQSKTMFYSYPKALSHGFNLVNISHIPEDIMHSKQFWITPIADPFDNVRSNYITTYLSERADRLTSVASVFSEDLVIPGFCCVAYSELNRGNPFRAEIVEFMGPERSAAKVLYVDYGHFGICDVSRFKICPPEILSIPRLAHLCTTGSDAVLATLRTNEKRRVTVESYCESTHTHRLAFALPTIDDLQRSPTQIETNVELPFEITYVEAKNQFYVKTTNEELGAYDLMAQRLQTDYSDLKALELSELMGEHCLVVAQNEDGIWKRGIVIDTQAAFGESQLLVQFIDSGETLAVSLSRVRRLMLEHPFDLPPLVFMVHISNVDAMRTAVTALDIGRSIMLRLSDSEIMGTALSLYSAECCDDRFLEGEVTTTADTTASFIKQLPSLPPYSLDLTGSTQRVVVTHFESLEDDFFVQLESDVPVIEELVELLNLLNRSVDGTNSLLQVDSPQIGQICASRFPEIDSPESMLYRCEVISLDPLTVHYFDYGNTEEVSRLLELPVDEPQLWTPAHAHRCRLRPNAKSVEKNPQRVVEMLESSEAHVDILFEEKLSDEIPVAYVCEVLIPITHDESLSSSAIPHYPNLVDGIYAASHISEDGTIWLQTEERNVDLLTLESDLSEIDVTQLDPLRLLSVGKMCIVSSNLSEVAVFRGEIVKCDPVSVTVLAIDYGPEETFNLSDIDARMVQLYSIPAVLSRRLLNVPRFAIPSRLLDERDAHQRLRLCDFPHVCYFVHFVQTATQSSSPPFYVDLRPIEDRASTTTPGFRNSHSAQPLAFTFPSNGQVKYLPSNGNTANVPFQSNYTTAKPESGFCDSVFDGPDSPKDSSSKMISTELFKPPFSNGSTFRGICVFTAAGTGDNGDVAFFHDETRSDQLDELFEALTNVSRMGPINFPEITVGSVVAGRYSVDGCWYRAIVLSKPLNRDSGPTVFFVDYGNCDKLKSCTSADIRQLPPSLSLETVKPLAIAIRDHSSSAALPTAFQLDEAYNLEVVSSAGYLSGLFAAACRIPILMANVLNSTSAIPTHEISKKLVTNKAEPSSENTKLIDDSNEKQSQTCVPTIDEITRYASNDLRKLQQTAPALAGNVADIVSRLGILRNSVTAEQPRGYFHDNRLLTVATVASSNVPVKNISGGGAFSVRPFTIAQLPKTCSTKSFNSRVVWISDDAVFLQLETEEAIAQLDDVDILAQKCGSNGTRIGDDVPPASLVNKPCLCKWIAGDGRWYRAVVRGVADSSSKPAVVDVFFVDFGNTDKVPLSDLVLLPEPVLSPDGDRTSDEQKLVTIPICSFPIVKGSHSVNADDIVQVCLEWRPISFPPYTTKSLELA